MSYQRLHFTITGVAPLVMHNGHLADPLNPHAKALKAVSGKRTKTEADHEQMAKLEFLGGLYLSDGSPCLPGELIEAGLVEAAKKNRRGPQAKAGIVCDSMFPLRFEGPKEPDAMWEDGRFRFTAGVRVQKNKVMRTRPRFDNWSAEIEVDFLPDQLNESEVRGMIALLGQSIGLGDWRPRFGRFAVH